MFSLLFVPIKCGEPCGTRCDFIEKEGGRCLSYDCSNTSPDCKKNGKCRISKSKNECVQDVQPECDRYPAVPQASPSSHHASSSKSRSAAFASLPLGMFKASGFEL